MYIHWNRQLANDYRLPLNHHTVHCSSLNLYIVLNNLNLIKMANLRFLHCVSTYFCRQWYHYWFLNLLWNIVDKWNEIFYRMYKQIVQQNNECIYHIHANHWNTNTLQTTVNRNKFSNILFAIYQTMYCIMVYIRNIVSDFIRDLISIFRWGFKWDFIGDLDKWYSNLTVKILRPKLRSTLAFSSLSMILNAWNTFITTLLFWYWVSTPSGFN